MGSSAPERRTCQLAKLRAAYDAGPPMADDQAQNRTAHHSRVLLGRILAALSTPHGGAAGPDRRSDKAYADV